MADVSVRAAAADDASAIAAIQAAAWRAAYGDVLPSEVAAAAADGAQGWQDAVESPPSERHHVLVALSGETVVGFAACGPAEDPDLDDTVDGELLALSVDPRRAGEGHGSRLVNAAVDQLRADGFRSVVAWLPDVEGDSLALFLSAAGLAADGAHRTVALDGDRPAELRLVRLRAGIGVAE